MADGISIDFDASSVNRFAAKLERVSGPSGALVSAAIRKTAMDVERDAKAFCPVDTGNLRNSISTSTTGDGRFKTMTAEIGPTAEYGIYVELGTSRMAPEAYLGPAFDRHAHELETALAAVAAKSVDLA